MYPALLNAGFSCPGFLDFFPGPFNLSSKSLIFYFGSSVFKTRSFGPRYFKRKKQKNVRKIIEKLTMQSFIFSVPKVQIFKCSKKSISRMRDIFKLFELIYFFVMLILSICAISAFKVGFIFKQKLTYFIRINFREVKNSGNFLDKLLRIDEYKQFREISFRES